MLRSRSVASLSVVSVVLFLDACAPAEEQAYEEVVTPAAVEAVDAGHEAFMTALNTGDVAGLLDVIASDAVFMPPTETAVVGKEAIGTWFASFFGAFSASAEVSDREVLVGGDLAVESGSFGWTLTPVSEGEPIQETGKFVAIWERQADGSWQVVRDIWNTSAAPAN